MRAFMRAVARKGVTLLGDLIMQTDQAFVLIPQSMVRETTVLEN